MECLYTICPNLCRNFTMNDAHKPLHHREEERFYTVYSLYRCGVAVDLVFRSWLTLSAQRSIDRFIAATWSDSCSVLCSLARKDFEELHRQQELQGALAACALCLALGSRACSVLCSLARKDFKELHRQQELQGASAACARFTGLQWPVLSSPKGLPKNCIGSKSFSGLCSLLGARFTGLQRLCSLVRKDYKKLHRQQGLQGVSAAWAICSARGSRACSGLCSLARKDAKELHRQQELQGASAACARFTGLQWPVLSSPKGLPKNCIGSKSFSGLCSLLGARFTGLQRLCSLVRKDYKKLHRQQGLQGASAAWAICSARGSRACSGLCSLARKDAKELHAAAPLS
ncbi:hypothetical protein NDU88_001835 [Pleurodeles waltl]|uniref:C2H2-type domain-containing protein n=1 Tax=Pleurodeles waltl TaxID=8319 RepID=A0AAV7QB88_PLEWA|nr:hypothetical protein NDU88_001835 [Pleurodeles waltl]